MIMNRLLTLITTISIALWFGGLATLMLLVTGLFARSHELGAEVAPVLFERFAYYHLLVGGLGLVGVVLWRMHVRSRWLTALAICVAIGMGAALVSEMIVTPKMQQLRRDGLSGNPTFDTLHRWSEANYGVEALALLAAICLLPTCIARSQLKSSPKPATAPEPALASVE